MAKARAAWLHRIEETGSLRAAAQAMGLSYSKALRMVKRAEKELGFALTRKTIGGRGGGGSTLTDEARNFMERYEAYRDACVQTDRELYYKFFPVSGKRHLLLTGGRGTGKTTLLRALVPLLCPGAQEITTAAYPADRVEIRESVGGKIAVIGRFDPALPQAKTGCAPWRTAFAAGSTRPAPHGGRESEWAVLDELGYLENSCPEFRPGSGSAAGCKARSRYCA